MMQKRSLTKYDYVKVILIAFGLYLATYTSHKAFVKTKANTVLVGATNK